jgi:hypothetical protein
VEIQNLSFFKDLQQAYEQRDTGQYDQSNHFACVRSIAQALKVGERDGLGTMVNIHDDHLVALTFDFKESPVCYGDSFSQPAVEEVTSVINWWMFHHTRREFGYQMMKVSAQKDGFLCGLLRTNGLGHFYLPEKYLLIEVAKVDAEHIWVLLRVVERHLDQAEVSPLVAWQGFY